MKSISLYFHILKICSICLERKNVNFLHPPVVWKSLFVRMGLYHVGVSTVCSVEGKALFVRMGLCHVGVSTVCSVEGKALFARMGLYHVGVSTVWLNLLLQFCCVLTKSL